MAGGESKSHIADDCRSEFGTENLANALSGLVSSEIIILKKKIRNYKMIHLSNTEKRLNE